MTATKNDKADAKPAMQFVHTWIWDTIRLVEYDPTPDFPLLLMDAISDVKNEIGTLKDILLLIARQYGRTETMRAVGLAMRAGEIKYGDWNFLGGHGRLQLLAAMERHAMLIFDGEENDPDTTARLNTPVPHYGCIVAGINMTWFQSENGTLKEDGPPTSKENVYGLCIESAETDARVAETNTGQRYFTPTR
jgi:hypothetical protein